MPSAAAIHTACFAVGAVVGGGLATVVSARRRRPELPPSGPSLSATTTVVPGVAPIIDVGPSGDARLPSGVVASALVSPVLKYGHPGAFFCFVFWRSSVKLIPVRTRTSAGPVGAQGVHGGIR